MERMVRIGVAVLRWPGSSLLPKIVIGMVVVCGLVGLALMLVEVRIELQQQVDAQRQAADSLTLGLASSLETSVRDGEAPEVALSPERLSRLASVQDVMRIDVYRPADGLLSSSGDGVSRVHVDAPEAISGGQEQAETSFVVYSDVPEDGHRTSMPGFFDFFSRKRLAEESWAPLQGSDGALLGVLRVYTDASGLRGTVLRATLEQIVLLAVAGALGLVLLGAILHPLLYVPISRLDLTARRIAAGERHLRAPVASRDELGRLAASVNQMTDSLLDYQSRANTDVLTGLYNHRYAHQRLDEMLAGEAQRVALMMMDLDDFKHFNDTYGHIVGDEALRLVAAALRSSCHPDDVICRYGGDEFMVLMPGADGDRAEATARRVLETLASKPLMTEGGREVPLTGSVGIAVYPDDAGDKHTLIALADSAMYQSKRRGGHGVGFADTAHRDFLISQASSFAQLERLIDEIDKRDGHARRHAEIVAEMALMLAEQTGLSEDARRSLRIAGLLHDVGKAALPDHLLSKTPHLSPEEELQMREHVRIGETIIAEVPRLNEVLQGVAHHHEHYDGSGYPRGLAGDAIPLLGRILAIAEAYAELRQEPPQGPGLTAEQALARLEEGAGTRYDPVLVREFGNAVRGQQKTAA